MNALKTKIRLDVRKLSEEYQQIKQNNNNDDFYISADKENTLRLENYCFPGSSTYGMRFLVTVSRDGVMVTERTKSCVGYINNLVDFFPEAIMGGWATMDSGFSYKPHIDRISLNGRFCYGINENAKDTTTDIFRIQVALETNPFCYLAYENGEICHIPVDNNLWMIKTNVRHTAWNMGMSIRTHVALTLPLSAWNKYANHSDVFI